MMLERLCAATRALLVSVTLLVALSACDIVEELETNQVQKPAEEQKTTIKTVTVTEGTNFAIALNEKTNTLAMSLQGVLFTLPASGGSATAITDYYQDAREPDWSPSTNEIAYYGYANGNWDLWLVPAEGGQPRAITAGSFDDREPRFSPDGYVLGILHRHSRGYGLRKEKSKRGNPRLRSPTLGLVSKRRVCVCRSGNNPDNRFAGGRGPGGRYPRNSGSSSPAGPRLVGLLQYSLHLSGS